MTSGWMLINLDKTELHWAGVIGASFCLGLVLGWALRLWTRRASDRAGALAAQQLTQVREQWAQASRNEAVAIAHRESAVARLAEFRESLITVESHRERLQTRLTESQRLVAELQTRLHEQKEQHRRMEHHQQVVQAQALANLKQFHERALQDLKESFSSLSGDTLRRQVPEFLRLAEGAFQRFHQETRGDQRVQEERFTSLIKPLEEQLQAYQTRLHQAETSQNALLAGLQGHLEHLSNQNHVLAGETQRLRQVLHSNQARGRWGEETLRRVVEVAGLSPHCDFDVQVTEGDKRPDLVVRLPGDRLLLIDSKVPDLDFLDGLESADESRRRQTLQAHARKVRETIRQLADRNYPSQFPDALPDIVLFLPAESLFSAALEGDREILAWAADRHVLLATPASMIGLLRAVALSWIQQEQSQNAREISQSARQLHIRVSKFLEHFAQIREGILRAARAHDEAVGSYERMVRPAGERLERLGGGDPHKTLPAFFPLDLSLRSTPGTDSASPSIEHTEPPTPEDTNPG